METMGNVVIIVPAYHASRTLGKCLSSLQKQTYEDFEAIIIDDGNEDDSLQRITESFSSDDSRFRYVRQANQGPGVARNLGLSLINDLSKKWVIFVDADDYIEPEYVERLLKCAHETGCLFVSAGGCETPTLLSGEDALCELTEWKLIMGIYDRIVHGSLLLNDPFGTWSRYGEDTVATFRELVQLADKKIALFPESFGYHYVNNPSSSTHDPLIPSKAVEYVYLWARIYGESASMSLPQKANLALIRRFDSEYLQMKGFIERNWKELPADSKEKYLFSKKLINQNKLLRQYMPKTMGERVRRRLCLLAPHLYRYVFSRP